MTDDINDVLGLARDEKPELPSDASMKQLSDHVAALIEVRRELEDLEEKAKVLRAHEQRLSTEVIPSTMDEIGVTSITVPSGQKVSYAPFYSGKINPAREPEAFDWIEENGHGGVIKGELIVGYRRPQRDEALALKEKLSEQGWDSTVKLGVHHSTLRALFREVIENGDTFPPDLFDLFIGRKTTIK